MEQRIVAAMQQAGAKQATLTEADRNVLRFYIHCTDAKYVATKVLAARARCNKG